MITPKELKKLADMCRKVGIKHFKQGDVEFTLSDDVPVAAKSPVKAPQESSQGGLFESDTLTQEALLFWSTGQAEALEGQETQIGE